MKKGKKLTKEEKALWFKFSTHRGGGLTSRCKINQFKFSAANTKDEYAHEKWKFEKGMECLRKGHKFIQEAYELKTNRRRDHVCLTEKISWEPESEKRRYEQKIKEKGYDSPNCIVEPVKLWEKK